MIRHDMLKRDYAFLLISLFLIAWMVLSSVFDSRIDSEYAKTLRARPGYEIRAYTNNTFVGDHIDFNSVLWWKEIEKVKQNIRSYNIEILDLPYFIKQNNSGEYQVFFIASDSKSLKSKNEFMVINAPGNNAFKRFTWYPAQKTIAKNKDKLIQSLNDNEVLYNKGDVWIEVKNHYLTIPFMMNNGVFIELE